MLILTFFLGLLANFIGYVPPGNINLTLVRITINRGFKEALLFITAFSIIEFFFTFLIMHAAKWLSAQVHLDVVIDWVMFALFVTLGAVTWLSRNAPPKTKYSNHASIKYGLLLGFINPMQVPYWMICGAYLITHEWILDGALALLIFSMGSAGGSFLCLFLYAKFALYIQNKFALSTRLINTAVAILFFALAGYHLAKRVYLGVKPKQEVAFKTAQLNLRSFATSA
jgi:threonine/homoserine/homoserine lactone efflux protein